jgi:glucokinase
MVARMPAALAIAVDLGGTNLKVGLVARGGRIVAKRSQAVAADRGPGAVVADMAELADALIEEAAVARAAVRAAGVGSPGPLSVREGIVFHCANLPNWHDVPLRDMLRERLKMPVVLDNDANVAAFGEFHHGAGRGCSDMVLLTLGTGVGSGIVLDGRIVHGHFENAGELGHMIVAADGLPCPCGQRGCLEQYASASSVSRRVVSAVERGAACTLGEAIRGGEPIDCIRVEEAAKAGDALCLRVWDDTCLYLAIAAINIQHAFNPARVVLSGGMSGAGAFLLDPINEHLGRQRWKLHEDLPEIRLSDLGPDAGLIGAAALAWQIG